MGFCNVDLVIEGNELTLTGSDYGADRPLFVNSGALTPEGQRLLADALDDVDPASLEKTYGCPDCADGGAAYLAFTAGENASRHAMEFGNPPAELAEAYALAASMMSALETCRSGELLVVSADCAPYDNG
jgi:hypothetical protein